MIRYYGESNVPGAPGQSFLAGGNFMGGQGSQINPEAFKRDSRQQKIYNKGMGTDNPNEKEIFLRRTGPQLPLAQAFPGMAAGQAMGNAGALGGGMGMGPAFGPRPFNVDVNAVDDRLESIGGSTNIQLDRNQTLRLGGSFNPAYTDPMGMQMPQGFSLQGAYETPGIGINVNYRNTGRGRGPQGMPGMGGPGGFPGEIQAGFRGKF